MDKIYDVYDIFREIEKETGLPIDEARVVLTDCGICSNQEVLQMGCIKALNTVKEGREGAKEKIAQIREELERLRREHDE